MEKTHTLLYQLPGGLFLENAPVYIPDGSLWQERQTQNLFAKLQLKNIAPQVLQSATVRLIPFDTRGALLHDGIMVTFTPRAEPNGLFAEGELTALPENSCAFGACVTQAVFADGSVWMPENIRAWHVAPENYDPQAPIQKK